MATKPQSIDQARIMKRTMRQTVAPPVIKTAGESRSPHLSQVSAADSEQSSGCCPQVTAKPHHKGGRGRPVTLQKDLVMDVECFVGIDVSKARLDGCVRRRQSFQQDNTAAGIDRVAALLGNYPVTLVVVEATGGLEVPLVRALQKARIPVAVVNPRQTRDFAKATGALAKTDAIDAEVLAHFAEALRPEPRQLTNDQTLLLDAVLTRRRQLIDMRTMEQNRLSSCADAKVRRDIQAHLDWRISTSTTPIRPCATPSAITQPGKLRTACSKACRALARSSAERCWQAFPNWARPPAKNWRPWRVWPPSPTTAANTVANVTSLAGEAKCGRSCLWRPCP